MTWVFLGCMVLIGLFAFATVCLSAQAREQDETRKRWEVYCEEQGFGPDKDSLPR